MLLYSCLFLIHSNFFERLLKLPMSLRPEVVQGTMRNFDPGFAFTLESAVSVLRMALLAYAVAPMIARLF